MSKFINPTAAPDDDYEPYVPKRRSAGIRWRAPTASCKELCGRATHCGNKFCSNHPEFDPQRGTRRHPKKR